MSTINGIERLPSMNEMQAKVELSDEWCHAIDEAGRSRRVVVLGPTDVGKSSFIRAFLSKAGDASLIDVDPGQKMVGPPGTASLANASGKLERFIFLGTTSANALSATAAAAGTLAQIAEAQGPFIANTSGFVTGFGARLQAMTVAALKPDLLIEIGADSAAVPIVAPTDPTPLLRLRSSLGARRKSPAARRALRQRAFDEALAGADRLRLEQVLLDPAPPAWLEGPVRPVCSLADTAGTDMSLGIIEEIEQDALIVRALYPARPVRTVRLGKMWAEPDASGWRLLDKLKPSWAGS